MQSNRGSVVKIISLPEFRLNPFYNMNLMFIRFFFLNSKRDFVLKQKFTTLHIDTERWFNALFKTFFLSLMVKWEYINVWSISTSRYLIITPIFFLIFMSKMHKIKTGDLKFESETAPWRWTETEISWSWGRDSPASKHLSCPGWNTCTQTDILFGISYGRHKTTCPVYS